MRPRRPSASSPGPRSSDCVANLPIMTANDRTCPSCGARVPAGADRCDLCGTIIDEADAADSDEADPTAEAPDGETVPDASGGDAPGVFCNQCGWENPPDAKYCSQCGEALQDLSEAPPPGTRRVAADLPTRSAPGGEEDGTPGADDDPNGSDDEQAAIGQQILLVVGGALLLVVGLFFVTQWSAQQTWGDEASSGPTSAAQADGGGDGSAAGRASGAAQRPMASGGTTPAPTDLRALLDQTADSLTGPIAQQIDSLRTRMEQASGGTKRQLQVELTNLLIGAGHPGRAALVQKDLADATGRVEARRRAADLLYRWMQKLQGGGQRQQVFQVARHAAEAYGQVADQRPDDLDARTRMGEAYLLTNAPMRGIKAINSVLDEDSTFVPARFQKGLALLQINRLDQATREFERVKQFAEDGSPFYQQADRALTVINERRQASQESPSAPAGG